MKRPWRVEVYVHPTEDSARHGWEFRSTFATKESAAGFIEDLWSWRMGSHKWRIANRDTGAATEHPSPGLHQ